MFNWLLFGGTLWIYLQNLTFVALPTPEIIGGTQKIGTVHVYAHAPFSPKFSTDFSSHDDVNISAKFDVRRFTHALGLWEAWQFGKVWVWKTRSQICRTTRGFWHSQSRSSTSRGNSRDGAPLALRRNFGNYSGLLAIIGSTSHTLLKLPSLSQT